MVHRSRCSLRIVFAVSLALVVGTAAPALATVVPGDDPGTAVPIVGLPFAATESLVAVPKYGDFEYWYVLPLQAGQTIEMTSTAISTSEMYSFVFSADYDDPYIIGSDFISPGVERMRYMAPHTGDYFICLTGSTAATFTVNAIETPASTFSLKSTAMPTKARPKKSFTASVKIAPGYNSSTVPVRFYVKRKINGHWKTYASKATKAVLNGDGTYSKYTASFKLPRGTFKIRARFKDAANPTAKYNTYKTVHVK